jgi:hypothetical protein
MLHCIGNYNLSYSCVIYNPSIMRGKESEEDADWKLKGKGDLVLCVVAVGFGN